MPAEEIVTPTCPTQIAKAIEISISEDEEKLFILTVDKFIVLSLTSTPKYQVLKSLSFSQATVMEVTLL